MTGPRPYLVDMKGLSKVLDCSVGTLYKNWRQYPHVYIGEGRNARSARFIVDDVLDFLITRDYPEDYASSRQKKRVLGRNGQKNSNRGKVRTPGGPTPVEASRKKRVAVQKGKNRVQTQASGCDMGKRTLAENSIHTGSPGHSDPFDLLKGLNSVS